MNRKINRRQRVARRVPRTTSAMQSGAIRANPRATTSGDRSSFARRVARATDTSASGVGVQRAARAPVVRRRVATKSTEENQNVAVLSKKDSSVSSVVVRRKAMKRRELADITANPNRDNTLKNIKAQQARKRPNTAANPSTTSTTTTTNDKVNVNTTMVAKSSRRRNQQVKLPTFNRYSKK